MLCLIIDDDPLLLELLETFLSKNGHQVIKALTAQDGLKLFTVEQPDVIFLDMKLPDKNGLDLLKEIKTIDRSASVVMITAFKEVDNVVTAYRNGVLDCLLKPFNFDYLKNDLLPQIPLRKR